jgi:hypothetical protein
MIESVKSLLPGPPVEIIDPVGDEFLQPAQLRTLFPSDAWNLIRPSGVLQPGPQIVEHFIPNVNSK